MCISDTQIKCGIVFPIDLRSSSFTRPNFQDVRETCGGLGEVYITGEVTSEAVVTKEDIIRLFIRLLQIIQSM